MAHLYTNAFASGPNYQGGISVKGDASTTAVAVTLPDIILALNRKAVTLRYKNRAYIIGQFSRLLVYNEYGKLVEGGIRAPQQAPTLGLGTFSGGSSGEMIGYLTFAHKNGEKVLQESSPSAPSLTLTVAGQGRAWSGIPATAFDPRVTHVFGYVSVDGSLPAKAWERTIGTTTVNENVSTGALGVTLAVRLGLDNTPELDPHARDVPPYTFFGEVYHDVMWYGGDPVHPERIYPSKRFEPESVNSTAVHVLGREVKPWLETIDGEPVCGMKRHGDELIIGCPTAFYAIQGYGPSDYSIRKISNYYGLLNHFSMAWCGPGSDLWMASQEGPIYYDGQFHHAMLNMQEFWRDDYLAHKAQYEQCYAAEDRFNRGYKLLIPQQDNTSFYYFGHYEPTQRGEQPRWVTDRRNRKDSVLGLLKDAFDETRQELHTGSCDGVIRKENDLTDADDDGDTYGKRMTIVFPHRFMGDQSGDDAHGRAFGPMDLYIKNENQTVTWKVWGGDDTASQGSEPDTDDVPPGAVTFPRTLVPRTAVHSIDLDVNGKGVTVGLEAVAPVDVEVRGYTIYHQKGLQERQPA